MLQLEEALVDSPLFRQKLKSTENEVIGIAEKLKKTLRACKQVQTSGKALSTDWSVLAQELEGYCPDSETVDIQSFEYGFFKFGQALRELENFRAQLFEQMNILLIEPIEKFVNVEVTQAKDFSKKFENLSAKYNSSLSKLSNTPTSNPKYTTVSEELDMTRTEFRHTSLDFVLKLNEINGLKKSELLETTISYIYSEMAFYHQGYEYLKGMEPRLKKLVEHLQTVRYKYLIDKKESRIRKNQLANTKEFITTNQTVVENKSKQARPSHEGYLFLLEKSALSNWKRKFFKLYEGKLSYFRDAKSSAPTVQIELAVSTVKSLTKLTSRDWCFEVVSPYRSLCLQAENQQDKERWVKVIQDGIQYELQIQQSVTSIEDISNSGNTYLISEIQVNAEEEDESEMFCSRIRAADPENSKCADCKAQDPTWASINLGVILCIQCSGIHRSLGTHISKIRSLTLDKLEPEALHILESIGNNRANNIWESELDSTDLFNARKSIVHFIHQKYLKRSWVPPIKDDIKNDELINAVAKEDMLATYTLLAQNANVNYHSTRYQKWTPLHIATKTLNWGLMVFLIQNGSDISAVDEKGQTPLHLATVIPSIEAMVILVKCGSKENIKDLAGKTPLDYAMETERADCVTLLRLSKLAHEERFESNIKALNEYISLFKIEFKTISSDSPTPRSLAIKSRTKSKKHRSEPRWRQQKSPNASPRFKNEISEDTQINENPEKV